MSEVSREELIRLVPAVASLPQLELDSLLSRLQRERIAAGTLVVREGEASERLYLLAEGEVEIIKALGTTGERLLAVRGRGSFIGEMSLFSREGLHTASVRAKTELDAIYMARGEMTALLSRQPALAFEVMRTISRRLDDAEKLTIQELLEKNRQLTQAYDELRAAQAQLVEKERLDAELQVARTIQRSFLPRRAPHMAGYDLGMLIEPVLSVGGDLCDFIQLKGNRLGIAIGDVTGHGVGSALFMALAFSLLRGEASRAASPASVLRNLNRQLLRLSDSDMFVTLLYGILDGPNRTFSYARAGHPPPLVLDAQDKLICPPTATGQPIGVFSEVLLDSQTLTLPSGSRLLLFTDGGTEASDAHGALFGAGQIYSAICHAQAASAQELCQAIYDAVRFFCGSSAPEDDILLIAAQAG